MAHVHFYTSQKGKQKLQHQGYIYNFHKNSRRDDGLKFWQCEKKFQEQKCLARVHVRENQVVFQLHDHNHAPDGSRGPVMEVSSNQLYMCVCA